MNDFCRAAIELDRYRALEYIEDLGSGGLVASFYRIRRKFGNPHAHLSSCSGYRDPL